MLKLSDSINLIKGVGEKKASRLNYLGLFTVRDLLEHYPVKYSNRRKTVSSNKLVDGKNALIEAQLNKLQTRKISHGRMIVECLFKDADGIFSVSFFNMPFIVKSLVTGEKYAIYGQMRLRNGFKTFTNPEIAEVGSEKDKRGIVPIYRCTQGLTNNDFYKWIKYVLSNTGFVEWLNEDIIQKNNLCNLEFSYKNIHFPDSEQHYKTALYRIIYDELLKYQLAIRLNRKEIENQSFNASIRDCDIDEYLNLLPFKLTDGQISAIKDIESDLLSNKPMNRLVQGDVGCGKTLVAETAIYKCIKAGYQAVLMAPTEILAKQHYENLSNDLNKHNIKTCLLISGTKASERREIISKISNGDIDLVVGTHAVIQDDVIFNNLGLAITDEQHRFGVNQRKSLMSKGRAVNICVMSATPIPRTLAATVFGDMDFSIIYDKPSNRLPIITKTVNKDSRERAYKALINELELGHQGYVVAPSINSEDDDISSVEELYIELKDKLPKYKIKLIHGKLDKDEKDKIMDDFASGKIDVLISTTVIEVGIDVPNATIIIIENCERFGLAQMHQLRGRVGRSNMQSYCYIINYSSSETAIDRANALATISDGFEISEKDYEMRGPGDLMGTMQSGNYQAHILSLCKHKDILELAVRDADKIIEDSNNGIIEYVKEYMNNLYENNSNVI